jgi:hypothetical protein
MFRSECVRACMRARALGSSCSGFVLRTPKRCRRGPPADRATAAAVAVSAAGVGDEVNRIDIVERGITPHASDLRRGAEVMRPLFDPGQTVGPSSRCSVACRADRPEERFDRQESRPRVAFRAVPRSARQRIVS